MPKGGGRETVKEVMGKYKRGSLYSGGGKKGVQGPKVDTRDQAIAIALSEAGLDRDRDTAPPKRRKRPSFGI